MKKIADLCFSDNMIILTAKNVKLLNTKINNYKDKLEKLNKKINQSRSHKMRF